MEEVVKVKESKLCRVVCPSNAEWSCRFKKGHSGNHKSWANRNGVGKSAEWSNETFIKEEPLKDIVSKVVEENKESLTELAKV